jgi:hypothetical protein
MPGPPSQAAADAAARSDAARPGEGRRQKVEAAISELLARRPYYAKRIGGDVGQGARPGQAERGAMGIIQSRTRQIRCYWYRWIIEGGMTKS